MVSIYTDLLLLITCDSTSSHCGSANGRAPPCLAKEMRWRPAQNSALLIRPSLSWSMSDLQTIEKYYTKQTS